MPFCIHCGVKLNHRYTDCPLCDIELEYNSVREEVYPLYPKDVHKIGFIKNPKNRKDWITIHFAGFLTFLLTLLTTGIDYYSNANLTWSLFSTMTLIFLYLILSSTLNFKRNPILLYTSANFLIALFLYGLDLLTTSNNWFLSYGFPSFISLQLISLSTHYLYKIIKRKLLRAATTLIITNVFLIIINEVTTSAISWSFITTSILVPSAIYLTFLDFKVHSQKS
ncbi:MAG: DUF6320 domain-containing protein [Spirochaetaceae bacterium]